MEFGRIYRRAVGLLAIRLGLTPHEHFSIIAIFVAVVVYFARRYLVVTTPGGKDPAIKRRRMFSKPAGVLFLLGLIGFCSMATEGAMFDWSAVYFKEVVKVPAELAPLGYAAFMIMMAAGRFVGDRLIAKFGRKRLLFVSGILISTGMLTAVAFPYLIPATIAFFMVGWGVSSVVPTVYSLAGRTSKTPGIALAAVTSVSYLGFLLGPPLIGWIAAISSLRASYGVIGFLGIGISILVSKYSIESTPAATAT